MSSAFATLAAARGSRPQALRRLGRLLAVIAGVPVSAVAISFAGARMLPYLERDDGGNDSFDRPEKTKAYIFSEQIERINNWLSGWRAGTIGRYENRIRAFSHPLKVFQYFASETKGEGVQYMTAEDFIRSLVRYNEFDDDRQPNRFYQRLKYQSAIDFFRLADTDGDGLISFSEYMIFLSLIMMSEQNVGAAFKAIDTDGNGTLSKSEFLNFMDSEIGQMSDVPLFRQLGNVALRSHSSSFSMHKCHGLLELFFSAPADDKTQERVLSSDQFFGFMRRLRFELRKLEFYQYPVDHEDKMSTRDFCAAFLGYLPSKARAQFEYKIQNLPAQLESQRFSFTDFVYVDRVAMALDKIMAQAITHNSTTVEELENTMESVLDEKESTAINALMRQLFTNNTDNLVDMEKFQRVLKSRRYKGLDSPRDIGFTRWIANVKDKRVIF